jgi:hypothetical protein
MIIMMKLMLGLIRLSQQELKLKALSKSFMEIIQEWLFNELRVDQGHPATQISVSH